MSMSQFFKCLNATIPLTCILADEYPSSYEISKKNGTVRGDCIACDALFHACYRRFLLFYELSIILVKNATIPAIAHMFKDPRTEAHVYPERHQGRKCPEKYQPKLIHMSYMHIFDQGKLECSSYITFIQCRKVHNAEISKNT